MNDPCESCCENSDRLQRENADLRSCLADTEEIARDWRMSAEEALKIINALRKEKIELERRLDEIYLKDRGKTHEINILTKENNSLTERLEAWREWRDDPAEVPPTQKLRDLGEIK